MVPISLWLGRVGTAAAQAAATGREWLSDTERARLDTISAPQRRAQFLAGRWGARQLMAAAHGGDALADWCLSAPPDSPPQLERGRHPLCVAISHSGDHVACAVYAEPVGLDLEVPRRNRNIATLSTGVCTAEEQARLRALPAPERAGHFYRAWTLKEAWLKRRGEGISLTRLATLHTRALTTHDGAEGRLWQQGNMTLALIAPASLHVQWHGTTEAMDEAEYWHVDEIEESHEPFAQPHHNTHHNPR